MSFLVLPTKTALCLDTLLRRFQITLITTALPRVISTYQPFMGFVSIESNLFGSAAHDNTDNRLGRGYPDISANGALVPAFNNGSLYHL